MTPTPRPHHPAHLLRLAAGVATATALILAPLTLTPATAAANPTHTPGAGGADQVGTTSAATHVIENLVINAAPGYTDFSDQAWLYGGSRFGIGYQIDRALLGEATLRLIDDTGAVVWTKELPRGPFDIDATQRGYYGASLFETGEVPTGEYTMHLRQNHHFDPTMFAELTTPFAVANDPVGPTTMSLSAPASGQSFYEPGETVRLSYDGPQFAPGTTFDYQLHTSWRGEYNYDSRDIVRNLPGPQSTAIIPLVEGATAPLTDFTIPAGMTGRVGFLSMRFRGPQQAASARALRADRFNIGPGVATPFPEHWAYFTNVDLRGQRTVGSFAEVAGVGIETDDLGSMAVRVKPSWQWFAGGKKLGKSRDRNFIKVPKQARGKKLTAQLTLSVVFKATGQRAGFHDSVHTFSFGKIRR